MQTGVHKYGRVLISRPVAQGAVFADLLKVRLGDAFDPQVLAFLPVIDITPVSFALPDPSGLAGIIFTSSNGVRVFAETLEREGGPKGEAVFFSLYDLPVYAVGAGTAETAEAAGFSRIRFVAQTASALCHYFEGEGLLVADSSVGRARRLLFVRGADVHTDFASLQEAGQFDIVSLEVYCARPLFWGMAQVQDVLEGGKIGGVTFFSERTARLFIENAGAVDLLLNLKKCEALCISKGVLESVRPFWEGELFDAASPDQAGMVDLVMGRLNERGRI